MSTDGIASNNSRNCPYSTSSTVHRRNYLNNTNDPYSTISAVHRRYYFKQQYKLPIQRHQYCPQTELSQTTIQTAHKVPLVLSTDGIISNNNTNCPYSATSTVHRRNYLKQQYKRPIQYN